MKENRKNEDFHWQFGEGFFNRSARSELLISNSNFEKSGKSHSLLKWHCVSFEENNLLSLVMETSSKFLKVNV